MSYSPVLDLGFATQDVRYSQGDDRTFTLTIKDKDTGLPKDLTDYVFSAGIISPAISFTVTNSAPTTGIITITIPASLCNGLTKNLAYRWYVKYVLQTKTRKYIEGNFFAV